MPPNRAASGRTTEPEARILSACDDTASAGVIAPPSVRRNFWLGTALIVLCATSFGFITTLSSIAYRDGGNPDTQLLLRFVAFVGLVGPLMAALGRPIRLPVRAVAASAGLAVLSLMMSAGYLFSVAYIPVSLAAMIFYSFPLMVGVVVVATGRESMTATKAVALLGAFAGLSLAIGPSFATLDPRGVAAALVAAVGVAFTSVYGAAAMGRHDGLAVNLCTNAWMLLAAGLYVLAAGELAWPDSLAGGLAATAATLFYVVGFASWFAALRLIAPTHGAMMLNVEPVVSILAATLVLGERLGPVQIAGVVLVLGMLTLMAARGRDAARESSASPCSG